MAPPRPGLVIAVGLVAEALIADVWLLRKGHDSISTCVRESPGARRATRWLSAHLTDSIRGDLLVAAGSLIARRQLPTA